jgi:hypothetical protein
MQKSFLLGLGVACVLQAFPLFAETTEPAAPAAPGAVFGKLEKLPAMAPAPKVDVNAPLGDDEAFDIASEPLGPNSRAVKAPVGSLMRIFLAEYAAELKALRAKKDPTPADTKRLLHRQDELKRLLVIYDQAAKLSPIVFTVSIQLGLELPSRLLNAIPILNRLKYGEFGGQASAGVTLAMVRNQITGRPSLTYGITSIAGTNLTFGKKDHDKLRPRGGVTWLTPAIAVMAPLVEDVPSVLLGDLQGLYTGGAGEISTPAGEMGRVSRTLSLGFYAKPKFAAELPDAGMIFGFHGMGGETSPPSAQLESLWFSVLANPPGGDGSQFRNPIPFMGNNRTSVHAMPARRATEMEKVENIEKLTGDEVLKRILEVQEEMAKSK